MLATPTDPVHRHRVTNACQHSACFLIVCFLAACAPAMAPLLPMPFPEPEERDRIEFMVFTPPVSDVSRNAVLSPSANIRPRSSVVIDVPADIEGAESGNADFTTRNYFNFAEQAIEKQLLLNGFVVKDRSKFEAILRDLRDCNGPYWYSCHSIDPAIEPVLRELENKRESGQISAVDYAYQVREFRNKFKITQQTGKRSENELADTSEVIRAASASETRADYILQISDFDTLDEKEETVYLLTNPEFRVFMEKHPDVRRKYSDEKHSYYPCDLVQASLNAKLIEVASGNIVWIGNHTVTELDRPGNEANIELEVKYRRYCTNCQEVKQFIDRQNTEQARIDRHTNPVTVPGLEYKTTVTDPVKISGNQCDSEERKEPELRRARRLLASRVANELIQTIRFADLRR